MEVSAVQTMQEAFNFDEFKTEELNAENTTKWITEGAARVWLREGLSIFRVHDGQKLERYFAVDFAVKPWVTVYCVKIDYESSVPPLRVACQAGVWRTDDERTLGLASAVFWKLIFRDHDIVTDSIQTPHGRRFWGYRIKEAFELKHHVYGMRIVSGKIKDCKEYKTLEEFVADRGKMWGPSVTDRNKRIAITLHPLQFKSHQKIYASSRLAGSNKEK